MSEEQHEELMQVLRRMRELMELQEIRYWQSVEANAREILRPTKPLHMQRGAVIMEREAKRQLAQLGVSDEESA